jgi:hypothetical protein
MIPKLSSLPRIFSSAHVIFSSQVFTKQHQSNQARYLITTLINNYRFTSKISKNQRNMLEEDFQ